MEGAFIEGPKPWEIEQKFPHDAAIAFGQGPIIDSLTKIKAEEAAKRQGTKVEDEINSWEKTIAIAMGYLYQKGEFKEAFFSGGKTGGEGFPSEAVHMNETMEKVFGQMQDKKQNMHLEDESTNTLENFESTLSEMDELSDEDRKFAKLAFVYSDLHGSRIHILAALYNIDPAKTSFFSAEQVVKVMVQDQTIDDEVIERAADVLIPDRDKKIPPRKLIDDWISRRIDPLNVDLNRTGEGNFRSYVGGGANIKERRKGFTFFEIQEEMYPGGTEGKDVMDKRRNEDMFSEGLLVMPANWLGFISEISSKRFRGIISSIESWNPGFLSKLGASLDQPDETIRSILRPYRKAPARQFVSLDWKPWNEETLAASQRLAQHIAQKKEKQ